MPFHYHQERKDNLLHSRKFLLLGLGKRAKTERVICFFSFFFSVIVGINILLFESLSVMSTFINEPSPEKAINHLRTQRGWVPHASTD